MTSNNGLHKRICEENTSPTKDLMKALFDELKSEVVPLREENAALRKSLEHTQGIVQNLEIEVCALKISEKKLSPLCKIVTRDENRIRALEDELKSMHMRSTGEPEIAGKHYDQPLDKDIIEAYGFEVIPTEEDCAAEGSSSGLPETAAASNSSQI